MPIVPRPITRPNAPRTKTKVLLVRQPVKSVRDRDQADPLPVRLAIGVIVVIGIVLGFTIFGYLGYRLGFAPAIRVPELTTGPGGALVTAALWIIAIPELVISAGMEQPIWLMVGFAAVAIPAASLGAVRPYVRGGPAPSAAAKIGLTLGALIGAVNAAAVVWWTASSARSDLLYDLPWERARAVTWLADMQTVAAIDLFVLAAASLWVVLVMRLSIPTWMKTLSASACFFAFMLSFVAVSASGATVAQTRAPRSVAIMDNRVQDQRLIVGSTTHHTALLKVEDHVEPFVTVDLVDRDIDLTVIERRSIADWLTQDTAPPGR